MNKSLYEYFDCKSKEELYEKMKNNDPSVKELKEFYEESSFSRVSGKQINSNTDLMDMIVHEGYLPKEDEYTAVGFNLKLEPISHVKFSKDDSFKDIFSSLNKKGFSRVAMIEDNRKNDNEFDTITGKTKFEEEFELTGVEVFDSFVLNEEANDMHSLISIKNQGGKVYDLEGLTVKEPLESYSTESEIKPLNDLKEYDDYSFFYAQNELVGLNVFEDKDEIDDLLVIGNNGFGKEHLSVLSFDKDYNIEDVSIETIGGVNSTIAQPLAMSNSLLNSSHGVIISHNHPSGTTTPSEADIHFTERMMEVSKVFEVEFLDHYIVGDDVNHLSETVHEYWADKLFDKKTNLEDEYYEKKNESEQLTLFEKRKIIRLDDELEL